MLLNLYRRQHHQLWNVVRKCSDSLQQSQQVRVRFAPSPTGELHLGGLRTAFYNFLFAKKLGGKFLIRIEDTDTERTVEGCVERIKKDCGWIGIESEEEIIYQSTRLERYKHCAEQLVEEKKAYRCFCTQERLEKMRETAKSKGIASFYDRKCLHLTEEQISENLNNSVPYVIRMKIPRNELLTVEDIVHGQSKFQCALIDDQIILKSDGFPTYHLASVVDDHDQRISHVIRGEEWLPSIPKHLLLYRYFSWKPPRFAHLPLLLNPDKSKLSKRQSASSLQWYKDQGFEKEAIIAYLSTLGWSGKFEFSENYFPTVSDLISKFKLDDVSKSGAIVDIDKMYFINSQFINYLATSNINYLFSLAFPILNRHLLSSSPPSSLSTFSEAYIKQVLFLCAVGIFQFPFLFRDTNGGKWEISRE